jgi:hypothetical protein
MTFDLANEPRRHHKWLRSQRESIEIPSGCKMYGFLQIARSHITRRVIPGVITEQDRISGLLQSEKNANLWTERT